MEKVKPEGGQWYRCSGYVNHIHWFSHIQLVGHEDNLSYVGYRKGAPPENYQPIQANLAGWELTIKPLFAFTLNEYNSLKNDGLLYEYYREATGSFALDTGKKEGSIQNIETLLRVGKRSMTPQQPPNTFSLDYKFDEDKYLREFTEYVDATYGQHYSGKVQTMELISKIPERGLIFCTTNIQKYADRFGVKDGHNRKDLLKIMHYALLGLSNLDQMEKEKNA